MSKINVHKPNEEYMEKYLHSSITDEGRSITVVYLKSFKPFI